MITITLADTLDDALPQTQCGQCGYKGCRPYAEAMAQGEAEINQCPPGGIETITTLARLTQRSVLPLDETRGVTKAPAVAVIDETWCIGCTLCIQACPVDAIAGAAKLMHTVIADECTGCELCIPPCPVDCITMQAVNRPLTQDISQHARARYRARNARLAKNNSKARTNNQDQNEDPPATVTPQARAVALALAKARERLAANKNG